MRSASREDSGGGIRAAWHAKGRRSREDRGGRGNSDAAKAAEEHEQNGMPNVEVAKITLPWSWVCKELKCTMVAMFQGLRAGENLLKPGKSALGFAQGNKRFSTIGC